MFDSVQPVEKKFKTVRQKAKRILDLWINKKFSREVYSDDFIDWIFDCTSFWEKHKRGDITGCLWQIPGCEELKNDTEAWECLSRFPFSGVFTKLQMTKNLKLFL